MHSTRQAIIDKLKQRQQATINELAGLVGVKPVTVRHHLHTLQAEGLVDAEERRQPVGRPLYIYRLTEQAQALFPQKYHRLAERLLDQLKETLSPEAVQQLMNSLADSLADDVREEFERLTPQQRMERLIDRLEQEGFLAHWRQTNDGLQLIEYHCPYYLVGQRHPEICQIDETLIRVAMDAEVEKEACLLDGDSACTFVLSTAPDPVKPNP